MTTRLILAHRQVQVHRSVTRTPTPAEQPPGQRQADPDHVRRVAVDALDEPAAEPVEGERAGHGQRFAGREVGLQLGRVRAGRTGPW